MIPSYENFKDFQDAGEKVLEYLNNHFGFALMNLDKNGMRSILKSASHGLPTGRI